MGLLIGVGDTEPAFPYRYYYGIEWDTNNADPACTRIGNLELHASLPVQSQMRRCILNDDGKVVYYLHSNDSTKRDTGAAAKLDGTDGQVMVELPEYYYRCEMEGTKRRYLMSTHELPGFNYVPKRYVSAYEAAVERSTNKLASVVNKNVEYRGGGNQIEWDNLVKSLLGMPITSIPPSNMRIYARNRGSINWNCYTYDLLKTLFWFFSVEYATFNAQLDFNPVLNSERHKQGGIGMGVTNLDADNLRDYNGINPFIPCGYTNSLGNQTGVILFSMPAEYKENIVTVNVPSYRGVENPFGHIWKFVDGIKIKINSDSSGELPEFFIAESPNSYNNSNYNGYSYRGQISSSGGYIKEITFGEYGDILPLNVGGSSSTYFTDKILSNPSSTPVANNILIVGGRPYSSLDAGFLSFLNWNYSSTATFAGTRLTYYPTI